jgi:hypothetical protein
MPDERVFINLTPLILLGQIFSKGGNRAEANHGISLGCCEGGGWEKITRKDRG